MLIGFFGGLAAAGGVFKKFFLLLTSTKSRVSFCSLMANLVNAENAVIEGLLAEN